MKVPIKKTRSAAKGQTNKVKPSIKAKKGPKGVKDELNRLLKGARKASFYSSLVPMLATSVDEAFDRPGWRYEVKWDGYRALAFMNRGKVELKSRNDKPFDEKFYPIHAALVAWQVNAIVDGEVVVLDENGAANFESLQNWRSEADGELRYYVFDLLWYNGYDIRQLPLTDRKAILQQLVPVDGHIIYSEDYQASGTEFLEAAQQLGLEGIMAKKENSTYHAAERTKDWLKIKTGRRQEVVIGGYTKNEGSRKPFSALLVGVFEGKKLVYTGKVGTGFSDKTQKEMLAAFKPLIIKKQPFASEPDVNKPSRFRPNPPKASAIWLKPKLVCEVSFTELTSDGVMRHPSFEGMRSDKPASKVVLEVAVAVDKIVEDGLLKQAIHPIAKGDRRSLLNPSEETQVKKVSGHELKFTNLSKVFWPKEKVTKRDLINYYYQVAPIMVPYLKDRPQSMNRHPNGIGGKSFYFKDVTGKAPGWVDTYRYYSDEERNEKNYLVATNEASLLYMANLGCIEVHPWSSTIRKPDHPTWCMIDLDPDKQTFDQVIQTALVTKEILDSMSVPSYCKTSGSTGLHIYIPLGSKYSYDLSQEFARVVATLVHQELPAFTSIERFVRARKGKMYIDFLQNRPHATLAAPYSLRPKPGATVSMPLHWEEVKKGLKMSDFTIFNALDRIKNEGDLFKPVLGKGIDLKRVIKDYQAGNRNP